MGLPGLHWAPGGAQEWLGRCEPSVSSHSSNLAAASVEKAEAGPSGHAPIPRGGSSSHSGEAEQDHPSPLAALHPPSARLSNGIRRHTGQGTIYYSAGESQVSL